MSLLQGSLILVTVYLFLLLLIERYFGLAKKIFESHRTIKLVALVILFILLSGVIGLFTDNLLNSYYYYVLLAIFNYLLTVAVTFPNRQNNN